MYSAEKAHLKAEFPDVAVELTVAMSRVMEACRRHETSSLRFSEWLKLRLEGVTVSGCSLAFERVFTLREPANPKKLKLLTLYPMPRTQSRLNASLSCTDVIERARERV